MFRSSAIFSSPSHLRICLLTPNLYMSLAQAAKRGQDRESKGGSSDARPYHSTDMHLLELTIMSAQNLFPQFKQMKTYAVATVCEYPDEQMITQTDTEGDTNPTWNDKFVLRVDESFLRSESSTIDVTIFAVRIQALGFGNKEYPLGHTRILVSTLLNPTARQMVALQIRRPKTLCPQGILNVSICHLGRSASLAPSKHDHSGRRSVSLNVTNSRPNSMRFEIAHKIDEDIEHAISEQRRLMEYSEPPDRSLEQEQTERTALLSKLERYRSECKDSPKHDFKEKNNKDTEPRKPKHDNREKLTKKSTNYSTARFWLCGCRTSIKADDC